VNPPAFADLLPATRNALSLLLLSMADDEFVIGFSDSEWTGIAPLLEEDVAMSSIAQDEIGHARALYELLAEVVADGRDADAWAYDRPPDGYYHARLLDHPRGDWDDTIVRRYLYDSADAVRLEAFAASSFAPLPTELALEMAGIVDAPMAELESRWRASLAAVFDRLDLPPLPPTRDPATARSAHSDAFRRLHDEFTAVRRIDPGAKR
jgi:1,2-phenylacetyl-CoA epoxidase catalytic subunit